MTNIERKALELVNEVLAEWGVMKNAVEVPKNSDAFARALLRAIEQHEAFRQEVSDAVESLCDPVFVYEEYLDMRDMLRRRFIIPKSDPLVDAMNDSLDRLGAFEKDEADHLRAALAKRGGRIVFDDM